MEQLGTIILIGVVAGVVWLVFRPRYDFVVRIRSGGVRIERGKVTGAFLDEVRVIAADFRVRSGWVGGVRAGKRRVRLVFGSGIPPAMRQHVRNIWAVAG
jgi:Protein of unknown function (DUF3634)